MCGISGIIAFKETGKPFIPKVKDSIACMQKRGPDRDGTYFHQSVGLGHVRLSIIDVSEAASQPFTDATGRYTIVYNGEIFNFKELRQPLINKGVQFHSEGDTEVILQLYITEGTSFLNKLNGFFAFAIYDKQEESLFIARDRYGIKPLLIYQDDDKLIFSSEMKGLFAYGIPKELDQVSLYQYLQLNYIPSPHSIFHRVCKLDPGTFVEIKNKTVQQKTYYTIPFNPQNYSALSYEDACSKLIELLDDSVKQRLISDVPLGAFLSGGIDSSVVVALASKYTDHLSTFSIGFKDEPLFDETHYAHLVAKKYNTNHTTFSLTNDDLFSVLYDTLDYTDEPFADSSALAVNILSKHTRKHVTVALSGDGADELFAGYNKHRAEYRMRNKGFTESLIRWNAPLWNCLPKSRNSAFGNRIRQFDRFAKGMKLNNADRYYRWCAFIDETESEQILQGSVNKEEFKKRKNIILKNIHEDGDFNEVLLTDMNLVLPGDMLTKVDMMSMANSLEVRTPFLDYHLVDFMFSLPSSYKVDKSSGKKVLRDAFRYHLPEELYKRPKHGFEVPLLKWFRKELNSLITDDLLKEEFIREQNIFNYVEIDRLKKQLFSGNPGESVARIWGLIVFQYWWKKHII
jgi:asparagine synthase (glutamine-hydrolysing)